MGANHASVWPKRIVLLIVVSFFARSPVSAQIWERLDRPRGHLDTRNDGVDHRFAWTRRKTRIVGVFGVVVTTTDGDGVRRVRTTDMRVRVRRSDSVINGVLIGLVLRWRPGCSCAI